MKCNKVFMSNSGVQNCTLHTSHNESDNPLVKKHVRRNWLPRIVLIAILVPLALLMAPLLGSLDGYALWAGLGLWFLFMAFYEGLGVKFDYKEARQ
jgi:pheromone shutdown protein TraB